MIKSNLEPIEESDLDLEGKVRNGVAGSALKKESIPTAVEREVFHEVSAAEKDATYGKILSKVQSGPTDDLGQAAIAADAQTTFQKTDAETQVQHLVAIAEQKGVVHAVKVAQHMQDNYILDTLHDRMLADNLHDALVKKGMIKEL